MTCSKPEPLGSPSSEDLLARAKAFGVTIPADQLAGVLAGAQRLREAALRLRAFSAEPEG